MDATFLVFIVFFFVFYSVGLYIMGVCSVDDTEAYQDGYIDGYYDALESIDEQLDDNEEDE